MAFEKKGVNGLDVFGSTHKFGIYAYINISDESVIYIGKCSGINESMRHRKHMSEKAKNKQKINKWLQNNPDKGRYEVIALCSDEIGMEDTEASLIAQFKAIGQCTYNVQDEIDTRKQVK